LKLSFCFPFPSFELTDSEDEAANDDLPLAPMSLPFLYSLSLSLEMLLCVLCVLWVAALDLDEDKEDKGGTEFEEDEEEDDEEFDA
jgi:hypothetical protein